MYYYTILCRVAGESNAIAVAYAIPFHSIRYATARGSISFHPLRYRSRLHSIPFATLPLAAPFHSIRYATARGSIPFHFISSATLPLAIAYAISNACIYIPYSPALRVYYHYFQNSPETRYLPMFVREYETCAPSSIKSGGRDADV